MLRYLRSSVLFAAALCLLAPAAANAATKKKTKAVSYPTVSSVSPMKAGIGDLMNIRGKGFRSGKNKNTVVFKRDGGRAVFVKAAKATKTRITITLPAKLLPQLLRKTNVAQFTRFRIRVLAGRLGRAYTPVKRSPLVGPSAVAIGSADDCDGDGVPNSRDADDDNDLLSDTEEARLGLQSCNKDSDDDGLSDGWEQYSAIDRNGGAVKPTPGHRSYPNALDPADGKGVDNDGDGLTNLEEYVAWATTGANKLPLNYSGGNVASAGRTPVPAELAYMDQDGNGFLSDFERDADGDGIPNKDEVRNEFQTARITVSAPGTSTNYFDYGIFTPKYLELAETQTKQAEPLCAGINQVPFYCVESLQSGGAGPDVQKVDSLDWLDADSDGDGIPDGADDVDHDDISNLSEYLTEVATPYGKRKWAPLNACVPNTDSRFCLVGTVDVDKDGIPNREDTDDDGDMLPDALEVQIGTDPLLYDSDRDGVSDAFEYNSAKDLNSANLPYAGKRPYPNALDSSDASLDFDQDGLTQLEEYKAWLYTGAPVPTTYSDGAQHTGGSALGDDAKDVDNDGLTNFDETHGSLSSPDWWTAWGADTANKCTQDYVESPYPGPKYLGTDFTDWDTDGDGVADGADDIDHDGYSNAQEAHRSAGWCGTYISTSHSGSDRFARVQPFNPCKPTYSSACHVHPPYGYYKDVEDWQSPHHQNG